MIPRSLRPVPGPSRLVSHLCTLWLLALVALVAACDKVPLLAPSQSTITLSASATQAPLNGDIEIRATVLEQSGSTVQDGTLVTFTTTLGTLEPREAQTTRGVAVARLQTGSTSGTARVNATSGGASTSGADGASLEIVIGAAAASSMALSAVPSAVPASGGTVTLTAVVLDEAGNRLVGIPVSFSSTAGALSTTSASSDATGEARVQLTTSREATVTATSGSRTATATITVNPAVSFTLATSANPAVNQPMSLTITPGTGPAPRVTIDWGDGSNDDIGFLAATRTVAHTYTAVGFYTIRATGTAEGDTFTTSLNLTVSQRPPVAVTASPTTGTTATDFSFTITPTAGALIQNVRIDYGDGAVEDLGAIAANTVRVHRYGSAGVRTVTVTQTETNSNVTTASVTVTVN